MTAKDAVAGLGGAATRLTALADPVYRAQPGAMGDMAARFTEAARAAEDSGATVDGSVGRLDGAWQGASADAFVTYMATFGKAGASLAQAMTAAAQDLTTAATGVQGARDALEGIFTELHGDAAAWLNANADKPEADKRAHVDGLASAYQGRVVAQVDAAEQAVSTAASALGGRAGAVDPKFGALPEPGGQPFTPAAGKPVEWSPTPPAPASAETRGAPGGGATSPGGGGGESGGGGGLGPSGGPPAGPPPGDVQEWIRKAIEVLRANGVDVTEADAQLIWEIIQHESGGNPNAINNWDSNAAKGTPSKGLMQTIDPTFQAYRLPGHGDIWNPVDNICAGVNYAISRYGSLSNVPGIKATHSGGGYVGY